MARTTRSSKATAASKSPPSANSSTEHTPLTPATIPPKLFVLPKAASPQSRLVSLPHPQTATPARYLVCPDTGVYEVTAVGGASPRSWLLTTPPPAQVSTEVLPAEASTKVPMAYLAQDARLHVATALDPLFLVLPALLANPDDTRFLCADDYFDRLPSANSHLHEVLPQIRTLLETRMAAVCDVEELGDELMFRASRAKVLDVLLGKAQGLVGAGALPASLEEQFVGKALAAPLVVTRRTVPVMSRAEEETTAEATAEATTEAAEANTAEVSAGTAEPTAADPTPEAPVATAMHAPPAIVHLRRLSVAFDFICARYLPAPLATTLRTALWASSQIDFAPLATYLDELAQARTAALAARSTGDFSLKRGLTEEQADARADKKRRLEEEKKKRAQASRGVKELKKVDTSGMKKLSAFFTKK